MLSKKDSVENVMRFEQITTRQNRDIPSKTQMGINNRKGKNSRNLIVVASSSNITLTVGLIINFVISKVNPDWGQCRVNSNDDRPSFRRLEH